MTTDTINIDAIDAQIAEELTTNVTFAIQTEELKKVVGKVERSIAKKAVQAIYTYIYMDVQDDKLVFRGINNNYMAESTLKQDEGKTNFKITAGNPGAVSIPGAMFIDVVKKLNRKNTEIKVAGAIITIKSGREFQLKGGLDGSEFPRMAEVDPALSMSISLHSDVLGRLYNKTVYATSASESRPILTGIYHQINGKIITCTATDAHRLARQVYEMDDEVPECNVTVPASVIAEAKKHLDQTNGEVLLHFSDNQLIYDFGSTRLSARTLDGNYPDVSRLIFSDYKSSATFHVGTLRDALSGATAFNSNQIVMIRIKPELNQCRINTREAEIGEFKEDIATQHGEGDDIAFAVNARYLSDMLARYGSDDYVRFEMIAGLKPFKAYLSKGDDHCLDLFVPVRTELIKYDEPVVIDNFEGQPEFDFNPFEADFAAIGD